MSNLIFGIGTRKTSTANALLYKGLGLIFINKKPFNEYFNSLYSSKRLVLPFTLTNSLNEYDSYITVKGGGIFSQFDACLLALTKALIRDKEEFKAIFRTSSLITTDSRNKERKKYGLRKARKAPQFSKR